MKKFFTLIAVAVMAFAAQSATLTVAEGTETNGHYPFYGLYCDTQGTISQMIYPADMLTDMVGKQITEIKFYSNADFSENLEGCLMNFALKIVEENEFPTSAVFELAEEDICGTASPVVGATEFVLTLAEPFLYEGGNLLVGTEVIETSSWKGTYFYGINTGLYGACYQYKTSYGSTPCYREAFLPMTTFTYEDGGEVPPVEPTEKTQTPDGNYQVVPDQHAVLVTITPYEGDVFFRIIYTYTDGSVTEYDWAPYLDAFLVYEEGHYRVEFYAVADGKLPSDPGAIEFTVSPITGIAEMNADKAVANVRYFNAAGQEMSEPNGLTIMVTTYTDGTTSTAKVIK